MATTATPSPVPSSTTSANSNLIKDQTTDIPVFLRKTYHMVDTADPDICTWSDDGESFIVKDPKTFEKKIIPQFFKHNKFSSFVRQLNFYSFRKIRYNDEIRIDPELEALTANYWRFYHPKFQKGHPEWLTEIKRSVSHPKPTNPVKPGTAKTTESSSDVENLKLKTEVTSLKERIEAMTKNIDQLTTMVQKVTLNQEEEKVKQDTFLFHKRPKVVTEERDVVFPDVALSIPAALATNEKDVSMEVAQVKEEEEDGQGPEMMGSDMPPSLPSPTRMSALPPFRETSGMSEFSDGFVDELFSTFQGRDGGDLDFADDDNTPWTAAVSPENTSLSNPHNRPSAELMNRLSDALSMLPRDVQEMIVDRLIEAIMAPKVVQESIQVAHALEEVMVRGRPTSVPQSPKHELAVAMDEDESPSLHGQEETAPTLPLAAATLAALLERYGKGHHDHDEDHQVAAATAAMKKSKDAAQKSLLIPVHA
ncbi:HSF-type DNA-binding protein [Nitzschia inconspicua]|uniref:HSF-type DNA-binding protein n=1 Tax=Nitzschia inconspicua TaxID=303405 RepID=A0A9K3KS80_9STRA|nr:HSF-type DNA-binding protein [Nitzschia inconspicua]